MQSTQPHNQPHLPPRSRFEQLYLTYRQQMFILAYSILHDIPLAEDCVQQTFSRVLGQPDRLGEIVSPKTNNLMLLVVKNIALNLHHARRKWESLTFDEVDGWILPARDDLVKPGGATPKLSDLMKRLPESYRDVLMLHYDNGCSPREIALLLELDEQHMVERLARARARLADLVAEEEAVSHA